MPAASVTALLVLALPRSWPEPQATKNEVDDDWAVVLALAFLTLLEASQADLCLHFHIQRSNTIHGPGPACVAGTTPRNNLAPLKDQEDWDGS